VLAYIENLTYNRFNLFARDSLREEAWCGAEFKRKMRGLPTLTFFSVHGTKTST
jgi:hypothetical protein